MFFLQLTENSMGNKMMIVGSTVMLLLAVVIIVFATMHQRKIIRYHKEMQRLEEEKQEIYLKASIRFQEEERSRIAADLHDDAGPLLATVRLYLKR